MLMSMRYRLVRSLIRVLLRCGVDERDLETAVLRHQLKVLRRGGTRPRFTDADRALLAAAAGFLSRDRWRSFLVGPDTLLRWHRELSRRRRGRRSRRPGRPPLDPSIKSLILRLGRENPRWGYLRIRCELLKLGVDVSATTIATVLRRGGLSPGPLRRCVRDAGSVARRNSGSRRARDRRLNLSASVRGGNLRSVFRSPVPSCRPAGSRIR